MKHVQISSGVCVCAGTALWPMECLTLYFCFLLFGQKIRAPRMLSCNGKAMKIGQIRQRKCFWPLLWIYTLLCVHIDSICVTVGLKSPSNPHRNRFEGQIELICNMNSSAEVHLFSCSFTTHLMELLKLSLEFTSNTLLKEHDSTV